MVFFLCSLFICLKEWSTFVINWPIRIPIFELTHWPFSGLSKKSWVEIWNEWNTTSLSFSPSLSLTHAHTYKLSVLSLPPLSHFSSSTLAISFSFLPLLSLCFSFPTLLNLFLFSSSTLYIFSTFSLYLKNIWSHKVITFTLSSYFSSVSPSLLSVLCSFSLLKISHLSLTLLSLTHTNTVHNTLCCCLSSFTSLSLHIILTGNLFFSFTCLYQLPSYTTLSLFLSHYPSHRHINHLTLSYFFSPSLTLTHNLLLSLPPLSLSLICDGQMLPDFPTGCVPPWGK